LKQSKFTVFFALVAFLVGFVACGGGGGQFSSEKKVMEKGAEIMEDFLTSMEKADDAKGVAAALNTFADEMEKIKPQMEELQTKYPDLDQVPEELAPIAKKYEELGMRMMSVMGKIMQYADDPDVQAAQERLDNAMQ
jgi:hypothetical protein